MAIADIGWGFIGAGNIARTALAPAVHAATGARLEAVAARDPERGRAFHPSGMVYGDYAAILEDPKVDVVYISLSNDLHSPWTIRALEAGKHVLCEKPLGLDSAEVIGMRDAAETAERLLVEATWNRWHPRTRRAHGLIAAGLIGTVTEVTAGFIINGVHPSNFRSFPNGGGALYDLGCYPIAAAMWATGGSTPVIETATARLNEHGVDLESQARLRLAEATVLIECAMDRSPAQWLSITGTEGSIDFPDSFVSSRNSESRLTIVDQRGPRIEYFGPVDPYTIMVEHVSAGVRGGACYLPPVTQSIEMIGIVEAINAAAISS